MDITLQQLGALVGTEVFYEESLLKIEGVYADASGKSQLILGDMFTTIDPVNPADVDFLLKPLKEIKVKHLEEMLSLHSPGLVKEVEIIKNGPFSEYVGITYFYRLGKSSRRSKGSTTLKNLTLDQHFYLINKGYDVFNILKKRDQ